MPLQKGFNDEIKALTQEPVQGVAANDTYDVVLTTQGKNLDFPLRMYASATPDGFLNFASSQTTLGDGATRVIPPMNGSGFPSVAATTINIGANTGAVAGGLTINLNGTGFASAFAGLTKTDTKFRRFVFALQQDGTVTAAVSAEAASQGALTDYGSIFATIGVGNYIGHIDLVYVGSATKYKTAGSATNVIEDKGIFRPSASGGGGGAQAPLVLQSASTPNVTIAGGYLPLADKRILSTWDGGGTATTNYGAPLSFSATTVLAASSSSIGGGGSPANSTRYHFYVDLDSLGTQQTIASGVYTNLQLYQVTSSNLAIGTTAPETVNGSRYVWMGEVTTTSGGAWSGSGATIIPATRMEGLNSPVATSPVASRPADGSAVGSVGSTGQIALGHLLSSKSFPSSVAAASRVWYGLASANDGSANAINLTNTGSVVFTANGILNGSNQAATFGGANRLSSTNALFNPGVAPWSISLWAKPTTIVGTKTLAATRRVSGGTQINFMLQMNAAALQLVDSTGSVVLTYPAAFTAGSWTEVGARFDGTATAYLYVNGREVLSGPFTAASVTSPEFDLGADNANGTPQNFYTGTMDEVAFVSAAMTAADLRRIASYRYDHNANVAGKNQRWSVKVYPNGGEPGYRPFGAITGEDDSNSVFWDFGDLASTDTVDVILEDLGLSPNVVASVPPTVNVYTSALPSSFVHSQPDVPDVLVELENGTTNTWAPITREGGWTADGTNVYLDSNVLPVPAASPNRVRITARPKQLASVGVPQAQPNRLGSVTSFVPIAKLSVSAVSGNTTVADSDGFETFLVTTGSSTITMTLPAAANNAGRKLTFKKADSGTGKITVARAGSDTIDGATSVDVGSSAQYSGITLVSDGTNWAVKDFRNFPTQQKFTSGSGTYTTPSGVLWIRVRMVGGGAGGAGGNQASVGGAGAASTFGSSFLTANGGTSSNGGNSSQGAGGSATIAAGAVGIAVTGGQGQSGYISATGAGAIGGIGGSSAFAGAGSGGGGTATAGNASTNSGSGGGGGGVDGTASHNVGNGGGSGGFIDAIIASPAATYAYAVGTGGTGASAGTNGGAGGNGAAGLIVVEEHYA